MEDDRAGHVPYFDPVFHRSDESGRYEGPAEGEGIEVSREDAAN